MPELTVQSRRQIELIDITAEVNRAIAAANFREGAVLLFVPHTTAAVTVNENADPDVVLDLLDGLDAIAPLHNNYRHGEGNSAAHIKSSLIGCSQTLPVRAGLLQLGTWQGVYFCEFDGPRRRRLQISLLAG